MRSTLAATVSLALAPAWACSEGGGATRPPNVVLVTIDTLRADHLGCYGYARPTSPRLDALAAGADRYTRCQATSAWTVPSHASLFTGRFPSQHGAHNIATPRGEEQRFRALASGTRTLAEALAAEGYRTAGFAANTAYLAPHLGFGRGFETYQTRRVGGEALNEPVLHWLDEHDSRPFFLFVNYMDAHRPYAADPLPGSALPPASREHPGAMLDRLYEAVLGGDGPVPQELAEAIVLQYDTGIAHADRAVGQLLDRLRELGLDESTLVVVTSDHGEHFGEHRLVEHSKDVYQEVLHVPLILKRPGQREGRVDGRLISLADVPALIRESMPAELSSRLARDFPGPPGGREPIAEQHYAQTRDMRSSWGARFDRVREAIFAGRYKLIRSSDGDHELYDLAADPGEQANLFAERPELAERLLRALERALAAPPEATGAPAAPAALGEADRAELRALGYL
ncbi:MAG TPA: sulfatase [Planctomycetota bacterium]|nr:sulfatase [Planctomycetota bacterium]